MKKSSSGINWSSLNRTTQHVINKFLRYNLKFSNASLTHCYVCQPTATVLLLWRKCLQNTFHNIKCLYVLVCPVLLQSLVFYGCHCFSVWLPSKVTLRFPASCNIAPQHIAMFPDSIIAA